MIRQQANLMQPDIRKDLGAQTNLMLRWRLRNLPVVP